jgi:hypothetical protein
MSGAAWFCDRTGSHLEPARDDMVAAAVAHVEKLNAQLAILRRDDDARRQAANLSKSATGKAPACQWKGCHRLADFVVAQQDCAAGGTPEWATMCSYHFDDFIMRNTEYDLTVAPISRLDSVSKRTSPAVNVVSDCTMVILKDDFQISDNFTPAQGPIGDTIVTAEANAFMLKWLNDNLGTPETDVAIAAATMDSIRDSRAIRSAPGVLDLIAAETKAPAGVVAVNMPPDLVDIGTDLKSDISQENETKITPQNEGKKCCFGDPLVQGLIAAETETLVDRAFQGYVCPEHGLWIQRPGEAYSECLTIHSDEFGQCRACNVPKCYQWSMPYGRWLKRRPLGGATGGGQQ